MPSPAVVLGQRPLLPDVTGLMGGQPTLAIEVLSPTTASADRGVKHQLSARYGVPHYWIVDLDARVIETYHLAGTTYEPVPRLDGTAHAALPPFPDLLLDPAAAWR